MTTAAISPASTAGSRRLRSGLFAAGAVVATGAIVTLSNVLSSRFHARIDVTATGEHELSPRTLKLLDSLTHRYRVVLAGEFESIDPRARERVSDVLDQFTRRSAAGAGGVSVSMIDAGSAAGQAQFDSLIAELAGESRAQLDDQARVVTAASTAALAVAEELEKSISVSSERIRDACTGNDQAVTFFRDLASAARINAQDLRSAVQRTAEPLAAKVRAIPAPATDTAAGILRQSLIPVVDQLGKLSAHLKRLAQSESLPEGARALVGPLATRAAELRDRSAIALDPLTRLPRPALRRIADVVAKGSAAIIVGPSDVGMTAVEFASLFPPGEWLAATGLARADLGRRAEELVGSAVASLERPIKPVVVLMHGETQAFLGLQHNFQKAIERLSLRGIDVIEWAAAVESEPAALNLVDPDHKRPVVYIAISPNTAAGSANESQKPGVERAKSLGTALDRLSREGKNVLLAVNPSVLPAFGQPDPVTAMLKDFGVQAESGRVLVREVLTPRGRAVGTAAAARTLENSHVVASAVKGLPMLVEWPVPLSIDEKPPAGVRVTPLYEIADDGTMWAETQWTGLWYARGRPELMPDAPVFDQGRDEKKASWPLVAACERSGPSGPQRLLVVGSNTFFVDARAELTRVDGRVVESTPGNFELLEAGVYWLACQDELIAQSPGARAVALVKPLNEAQLRLVRLLVMLGLPVGVLGLGLVWRWARG